MLIYCFTTLPLFVEGFVLSLVWYALLYVLSSFAIMLTRKRELVALLLLSFGCLVSVNVLQLFLTEPWVGLQFMFWYFLIILTYLHVANKMEDSLIWVTYLYTCTYGYFNMVQSNKTEMIQYQWVTGKIFQIKLYFKPWRVAYFRGF